MGALEAAFCGGAFIAEGEFAAEGFGSHLIFAREQRAGQVGAPEAHEVIEKHVGAPAEQVAKSIACMESDLRFDDEEIRRRGTQANLQKRLPDG